MAQPFGLMGGLSVPYDIKWGSAVRTDGSRTAVLALGDRGLRLDRIAGEVPAIGSLTLEHLIRHGLTDRIQQQAFDGDWFNRFGESVADIPLTVPLHDPERIVGVGLNYRLHAHDLGEKVPEEPATFMKPTTTLLASGETLVIPRGIGTITAEAEIALVFGRSARNTPRHEWSRHIFGLLTVIDMTAETVLRKNPRFLTRAKSYDGFLVLSPWIVPLSATEADRPRTVRTLHNGLTVAENTTEAMQFPFDALVWWLTQGTTIRPTALLSTGTPGAVAVSPGDQVTAWASGLPETTVAIG